MSRPSKTVRDWVVKSTCWTDLCCLRPPLAVGSAACRGESSPIADPLPASGADDAPSRDSQGLDQDHFHGTLSIGCDMLFDGSGSTRYKPPASLTPPIRDLQGRETPQGSKRSGRPF